MTIRQQQNLLAFLGYYVGNIDGIVGQMTTVAVKAFQKDFGITSDGICGEQTQKALRHAVCYGFSKTQDEAESGEFWDDIEHFDKAEFACRCGCEADEMNEKLIRTAEKMRNHFGVPVCVTSGRRCANHNARVGGVVNSRHLLGKAMDFRVDGKTSAEVLNYVQKLSEIRYAYAIDGNHVHMDVA